ncbi:exo-rhamnogalacturonan lyase family protein [Paenibacillus sp. Leaf72]|uniref:exo-rhamnogalacturonan lyase family protein n=1 Tax=Paenibacillus sp. Leaf72 TaxID=1736234 RepID=UPI0006FFD116|nr:hypothetical protein [Paenibacillus sp. Leaf72]KQN97782.1 hypothetical protein ASF12_21570 [Paenibacillus sp. Leaf72]
MSVKLKWLGKQAAAPVGLTWGVPWKEGELLRGDSLILHSEAAGIENAASASALPMQSWPTAFWPDGSIKWSAHAAVGSGAAGSFQLELAKQAAAPVQGIAAAAESEQPILKVVTTDESIIVDTGVIVCTLARSGRGIIRSIRRGEQELCSGGDLVCLKESRNQLHGALSLREEPFHGFVHTAAVEQDGPVRAVIKLTGKHRASYNLSQTADPNRPNQQNVVRVSPSREWIPFTLRFYLYAGLDAIRLVHTFFYDGNPHADYIKGLGLSLAVPMRGPLYNRHARLAGNDGGFLRESPKSLHTRRTKGKYRELFERQVAGEAVAFDADEDAYFLGLLENSAVWDDFKLVQHSADHYVATKRTKAECSWLKAGEGSRAEGLAYIGSEGGGLAAGMRNFWEKHPASLELRHTASTSAELNVWFWSPDAPAMDLRHYDTQTYVESAYEGSEELRATPYGIANTSELTLWCTAATPNEEGLAHMLAEIQSPSQLVCEPEHLHEARAFGIWSLPDRSTAAKAQLEERLDGIVAFYQAEVEQRRWYGFWDFGDFMHSYDPVRHVWNYDLGGCAWQNSELVPNMWLWLMFMRSGREDIFRLAEAMTRHTSEVDVYHFGEYAGLGSRHNVVHWGCGCKEARIAMAGLHRYYYYLTADERIGDMLDEVKDADFSTVVLDPMRAYFPKDEHPAHIRVGPDWAAFSSNWMTRWERFEDTLYRDKIVTGINSVKQAKYRLISGPTYGYDPTTNVLTPFGEDNYGRHLAICMGAPQVWFELAMMLKDPEWEDMMGELGVYYNWTQEQKDELTGGEISDSRFEHPVLSIAITAYGAFRRQDAATAAFAWKTLLGNAFARTDLLGEAALVQNIRSMKEIDWINTNEASQWSLNTIISLELIPEALPAMELAPPGTGGDGQADQIGAAAEAQEQKELSGR